MRALCHAHNLSWVIGMGVKQTWWIHSFKYDTGGGQSLVACRIWLKRDSKFGCSYLRHSASKYWHPIWLLCSACDIWQFSLLIAASVTPKTSREIRLDTNLEKYLIGNSVPFWVQEVLWRIQGFKIYHWYFTKLQETKYYYTTALIYEIKKIDKSWRNN